MKSWSERKWVAGIGLGADWSEQSRSIAITLRSLRAQFRLHAIFNSYWEPLVVALPAIPQLTPARARCGYCTGAAVRYPWETATSLLEPRYLVPPRSVASWSRQYPLILRSGPLKLTL